MGALELTRFNMEIRFPLFPVYIISLLYSFITKMYTNCQYETVTYGPSMPSVWFSQTFTVKRPWSALA